MPTTVRVSNVEVGDIIAFNTLWEYTVISVTRSPDNDHVTIGFSRPDADYVEYGYYILSDAWTNVQKHLKADPTYKTNKIIQKIKYLDKRFQERKQNAVNL